MVMRRSRPFAPKRPSRTSFGVLFHALIVIAFDPAAGSDACDEDASSTLWAAGSDRYGAFGAGRADLSASHPVLISSYDAFVDDEDGISDVAAGFRHSAIVLRDGTAHTAGNGAYGQLGHGDVQSQQSFTKLSGLPSNVQSVAAGTIHTVFVTGNGEVWSTGYNGNGRLGLGDEARRISPARVFGIGDIVGVAAGDAFTLFLQNDGAVFGAGRNVEGQLCLGDTADRHVPIEIPGLTGVVHIAAGERHSVFVKSDGTAWSCGKNDVGQLGVGDKTDRSLPVNVVAPPGAVIGVAASASATVLLLADGTAVSTGSNLLGELGAGLPAGIRDNDRDAPGDTVGFNDDVVDVFSSANANQFHFLLADGTLWATGENGKGELGVGDESNRISPVEVEDLAAKRISRVACGWEFTLFASTACESDETTNEPSAAPQVTPASVNPTKAPSIRSISFETASPSKMFNSAPSPAQTPNDSPTSGAYSRCVTAMIICFIAVFIASSSFV